MKIIEPKFETNIDGFNDKGRGPSVMSNKESWNKIKNLYFVCANYGSMMHSITNNYFFCESGVIHHDLDAFRFGSTYSDKNIFVYEKE